MLFLLLVYALSQRCDIVSAHSLDVVRGPSQQVLHLAPYLLRKLQLSGVVSLSYGFAVGHARHFLEDACGSCHGHNPTVTIWGHIAVVEDSFRGAVEHAVE